MDRVRLDLHTRVVTLRQIQGKGSEDAPLPCCWIDPTYDLDRVEIGLVRDLEEIREWERSRRMVTPENRNTDFIMLATNTDQSVLLGDKESMRPASKTKGKGKGKAVKLEGKDIDHSEWAEGLSRGHQRDIETELEVVESPASCARTDTFPRLRKTGFQRPRITSLLHQKNVNRAPRGTNKRDDAGI